VRRRAAALAVLAALTVFASACRDRFLAPSGTGVSVLVERGPIQPTATAGEPNTEPVEGAEVVAGIGGLSPPIAATTDSAGHATIPLRSGTYTISLRTCPGSVSLPDPVPARVERGRLTDVHFVCDTGIR